MDLNRTTRALPGIGVGGLGAIFLASGLRVVGRGGIIGRFLLASTPERTVSAERSLVAVALAHSLGLALAPSPS